jgi:hypothetical protein
VWDIKIFLHNLKEKKTSCVEKREHRKGRESERERNRGEYIMRDIEDLVRALRKK